MLPTELLDKVLLLLDLDTQEHLLRSRVLHQLASPATFAVIAECIHVRDKQKHARLLKRCLDLLPWHVWDDGSPIKKRT